ncbi:MAG: alpha/beta fold hydrolase [Candidatus Tectomicrobia bacterium]
MIYFGTNRNPNRNATGYGAEFSRSGLHNLRFGTAQLGANGRLEVSSFPDTNVAPDDPGSRRAFEGLRTQMLQHDAADLLVYIHGFNVSFPEAMRTALKLQQIYTLTANPVNVIAFSWPSDGEVTGYKSDRLDAEASGPGMGRGMQIAMEYLRSLVADERCKRKLHLLAHSMGNYVLQHTLTYLRRETGLFPIFDQIVLAAADVDEDVFDVPEKMGDLHRLGRHITVYHNEGDLALTASDWFKGNPDRLGSEGPARPHDLHRKVKMVDCHAVADIQHSYYHEVDIVAKDIAAILAGTAPTQRRALSANRFEIREP